MGAWLKVCDAVDKVILAGCRCVIYTVTTILFFLLATNVFLRYLAGSSLQSAGEAPELLFPWLVIAGVVYAAQHGSHIGIVFLMEKFSPGVRLIVASINSVILIVGYAILAWSAIWLLPITHYERSHVLGVPNSVTFSCVLLGFSLLTLTAITQLIRIAITRNVDSRGRLVRDNQ